ncbi:hypothetical protein BcepF1.042 [Burkholderia phage BcepF1]|uniref:Uncharacterized protein n=1 Tax=Burkholderia phage BcepF1 TaxID=2886897 RepID=A1YZU6_9CAUD|nr:hypothetical protein BcepF1.042 [Burkholderia phage BcepF1]ABL96773.1 hypothetical protein BcepF1.042 [Burkholderia phage BcepF1]
MTQEKFTVTEDMVREGDAYLQALNALHIVTDGVTSAMWAAGVAFGRQDAALSALRDSERNWTPMKEGKSEFVLKVDASEIEKTIKASMQEILTGAVILSELERQAIITARNWCRNTVGGEHGEAVANRLDDVIGRISK